MTQSSFMQRVFARGGRRRFATLGASLAIAVLAGCGGGSGGGVAVTPAPVPCDSAASASTTGYAIGMCASTKTAVFLDVNASVAITQPLHGYVLSLVFPTALQAHNGSTGFTIANYVTQTDRSLVGALLGVAYEAPYRLVLDAPYVALTDFHDPCCYHDNPQWPPPQLIYAGYGTWENVPTRAEGFVGAWFSPAPFQGTVVHTWPTGALRIYRGYVAGTIAPDETGGGYLDRARSFSAPIEIHVDGTGQIVDGQIGALAVVDAFDNSGAPIATDLPIDPIDLVPAGSSVSPGLLSGTLASAGGPDADVDPASSRFEAQYFGLSGNLGAEISGRLRLRTSNGLIAVAAFGAR